jgi:hypothetical protein
VGGFSFFYLGGPFLQSVPALPNHPVGMRYKREQTAIEKFLFYGDRHACRADKKNKPHVA